MKQYIDKNALLARIKKLKMDIGNIFNEYDEGFWEGRVTAFDDVICSLNTLEVKEVDLEKEIKNRIDNLSNLYCYMEDLFNGNEEEGVYPIPENVKNELFEFAKYFFELGIKGQKGK